MSDESYETKKLWQKYEELMTKKRAARDKKEIRLIDYDIVEVLDRIKIIKEMDVKSKR